MDEISALGDAIAETAAMIDVATHRFLTQLREFDRVEGWHRAGALSCAHWLSWRVGMDLGAAREKVRVARRLAEAGISHRTLPVSGVVADLGAEQPAYRVALALVRPRNLPRLSSILKP